jgi:xanthine dehydrogenase accessory factor
VATAGLFVVQSAPIMRPVALIRGGGELGSAIAHAFASAGARVLVLDRPLPTALRLHVTFSWAAVLPAGQHTVEGVTAVHCADRAAIEAAWARGEVALWTADPLSELLAERPDILVDARMRSLTEPMARLDEAALVIGVGPGFEAGRDVHVVIESNRGARLGEPITSGAAEAYTGVPGDVLGLREERLLRAPCAGRLARLRDLGDFVDAGEVVATVEGEPVLARIAGMVRGLKLDGVAVGARHKVGDVDPRRDRTLLAKMTDKARAVSLGALQAAFAAGALSAPPPAPEAPRATPCI